MRELIEFYNEMDKKVKRINAVFVFVYNGYETYLDDEHLEECYTEDEKNEVIVALTSIFEETMSFSSEDEFIVQCNKLKQMKKQIFVYSMAQNITGYNRRTLIPALCDYYGFININADAYMSALGCNKMTMFKLLSQPKFDEYMPKTLFLTRNQPYVCDEILSILGKDIIIKPNCESCCIGVKILKDANADILQNTLNESLSMYQNLIVQEFIPGKEIGITVFHHNNTYYALQPIEIVFNQDKDYLEHIDSYYDNYQLKPYHCPDELLLKCEEMSRELEFECITRFDFRFNGDRYFLFDISPNPTLNDFSSCNYAVRNTFKTDFRGVYKLLAYEKIDLFKPTF